MISVHDKLLILTMNRFFIRLDLNAAESGVQHNPSQPSRTNLSGISGQQQGGKDSCSC